MKPDLPNRPGGSADNAVRTLGLNRRTLTEIGCAYR